MPEVTLIRPAVYWNGDIGEAWNNGEETHHSRYEGMSDILKRVEIMYNLDRNRHLTLTVYVSTRLFHEIKDKAERQERIKFMITNQGPWFYSYAQRNK